MRFSDITDLAARIRAHDPIGGYVPSRLARELADAVLDILRVEFPCGWAEPQITGVVDDPMSGEGNARAVVVWQFDDATTIKMTREEALGIGAAIAARALELPEGK